MLDIPALDIVTTALSAVMIFYMADLLIALVHHSMDRFGNPDCWIRWLAKIYEANRRHHAWPLDLLRHGPLANAAETLPIAGVILLAAWLIGMLTWHVVLFAAAVAFSAVYHRILHLPREQVCAVFKILQQLRILQDKRMHMHHHAQHDVHYSVLSNAVNHFLSFTKLLQHLERLIEKMTGRKPYDLHELSDQARLDKSNK